MPKPHNERIAPTRTTVELTLHQSAEVIPAMMEPEFSAFCADIRTRGILVPLEITEQGTVLDGRHRLRAAQELAVPAVPVRIVSPSDEHEYILLAALLRRHLTASQKAALAVELDCYREAKRKREPNGRGNANITQTEASPTRGERTREFGARLAGVSARVIQDAETVRAHDPHLFEQVKRGQLPVHKAARKVRRAQRDAALPAAPPLPEGPFDLIYADPPWQIGNADGEHAPENHYPTMLIQEIASLAIPAAPCAILFLWAVNCRLPQALEVMRAWGFEYKTNLVWVKQSIGLGRWARNRHELLLVGRKGSFPPAEPEDLADSVIEADRRSHSEKPECVYQLLERMYPRASKLELFARGTPHPGWVGWGNEAKL